MFLKDKIFCNLNIFDNKKKGFTLIEMLVAVAIFFIITGAILINIPQFKNRVNIDLITGEASLYIRSAQVYALGTKGLPSEDDFTGEFFTVINSDLNTIDIKGKNKEGDEVGLESYTVPAGFDIQDIKCGDIREISQVKIIFKRPNPEVDSISYFITNWFTCDDSVEIVIFSESEGTTRSLTINKSGHIGIK